MHRIKLNDRMTFPEELDMSPFIDVEDEVRAATSQGFFVVCFSLKLVLLTCHNVE